MKSPILYIHYTAIMDLNHAKKESQSLINQNIFKKQNFKKWLSIAIFGRFAESIARQNGYKMMDCGNEVLINHLDD